MPAPHCEFQPVIGLGENSACTASRVRALPEVARNVLPSGLHVRDGAAAVADQGGQLGLVVTGRAAVSG